MAELSTLGSVIKTAYEGQADTNAFTDAEKLQLATALDASEKGAADGVATLDSSGMVPLSQLNVSGLSYQGVWDPSTNTPALIDGTGTVGAFYKANGSGSHDFGDGSYDFVDGDWVIYAAGVWQRIGSHETVSSVNGKTGAVVLDAADVGALPDTYTPPAVGGQNLVYTGVAASRSAGVWYTNNTGYPLTVFMHTHRKAGYTQSDLTIRADSGSPEMTFYAASSANNVIHSQTIHLDVPAGYEYRINLTSGRTVYQWIEGVRS